MEWLAPQPKMKMVSPPATVLGTDQMTTPVKKKKGYRPAMMALADEDLRLSVGGRSGAQTLNVQKLGY